MSKEKCDYYWNQFLQTGSIDDYLNYKFYRRKMENDTDGQDREISRNSYQENRL